MTKMSFFGEQILESDYGVNVNECYCLELQRTSQVCVNVSQVDTLMDRPKHTHKTGKVTDAWIYLSVREGNPKGSNAGVFGLV